jgi:hypothetical protein
MAEQLLITPQMMSQAKANKCIGMMTMNPYDFIRLTINQGDVDQWIKEEAEYTKTVEEYNEFARKGDSIHPPWLEIDMETGKVVGHEGRHRSAALIKEGVKQIPVAVMLRKGSRESGYWAEYYVSGEDPKFPYKKRFYGLKDIPKVWTGQFYNGVRVTPDLSTFKGFYV